MEDCQHRFCGAEVLLPGLEVFTCGFHVFHCTPSTACQSPSACMITRSSAYAYFLETVMGRSEMWMLKRRGAVTDPSGTPFLRYRNLFRMPFLVVRVKLQLPTISMIMWTMCLSGSSCSSLQVRRRCHTVSWAAVRSTNTPLAFLAEKLFSMSCVSRVTWSTADLPCQESTYSWGSNGFVKGRHSRDSGR